MDKLLTLDQIKVFSDGRTIFRANHIEIPMNGMIALVGSNGAGKTTLLRVLAGLEQPDRGEVRIDGAPVQGIGSQRAVIFQEPRLLPWLTVLDNVLLGSEPLWQPFSRRSEARAKLLAVSQQFGLPVSPDAKVGSLSVGERQRVEILKALYRGARILILDEPTAVLTPQESEALFDTLAQMVAQGLSIIFISHKLGEVLRVSHRVAVLRQGKLVAEAIRGESRGFDLFSSVPHMTFPGGPALRSPLLALGMLWHRMKDLL